MRCPSARARSMLNHGIGAALAGGWQTNWILSRESGTPFSVSASATSLNSPGNSQTANQVLPTVAILGGYGPGEPYFNPNAFAAVTTRHSAIAAAILSAVPACST